MVSKRESFSGKGAAMRFDSSQAWKEASTAVAANRELLLALAGVFFLLPGFAIDLIVPKFQPQPGLPPREALDQLAAFYSSVLPYLLLVTALQLVGTLAMLTLFTDRSRPTVGQAIRLGALGALPCVGAQLLLGAAVGIGFLLLIALGAASGSSGVALLLGLVGAGGAAWLWVRLSLVAPVVAVERVFNPIAALTRSWNLTRDNALRLLAFYILLIVAFVLVAGISLGLLRIVLALAMPAEGARILGALVSSALTAVMALYFVAVLAAVHRQLAGPSPDSTARTFD